MGFAVVKVHGRESFKHVESNSQDHQSVLVLTILVCSFLRRNMHGVSWQTFLSNERAPPDHSKRHPARHALFQTPRSRIT